MTKETKYTSVKKSRYSLWPNCFSDLRFLWPWLNFDAAKQKRFSFFSEKKVEPFSSFSIFSNQNDSFSFLEKKSTLEKKEEKTNWAEKQKKAENLSKIDEVRKSDLVFCEWNCYEKENSSQNTSYFEKNNLKQRDNPPELEITEIFETMPLLAEDLDFVETFFQNKESTTCVKDDFEERFPDFMKFLSNETKPNFSEKKTALIKSGITGFLSPGPFFHAHFNDQRNSEELNRFEASNSKKREDDDSNNLFLDSLRQFSEEQKSENDLDFSFHSREEKRKQSIFFSLFFPNPFKKHIENRFLHAGLCSFLFLFFASSSLFFFSTAGEAGRSPPKFLKASVNPFRIRPDNFEKKKVQHPINSIHDVASWNGKKNSSVQKQLIKSEETPLDITFSSTISQKLNALYFSSIVDSSAFREGDFSKNGVKKNKKIDSIAPRKVRTVLISQKNSSSFENNTSF